MVILLSDAAQKNPFLPEGHPVLPLCRKRGPGLPAAGLLRLQRRHLGIGEHPGTGEEAQPLRPFQ
ncbi:hypothetical protein GCM10027256_03000 [Novispirillum itersonii subsp. nipponicum]